MLIAGTTSPNIRSGVVLSSDEHLLRLEAEGEQANDKHLRPTALPDACVRCWGRFGPITTPDADEKSNRCCELEGLRPKAAQKEVHGPEDFSSGGAGASFQDQDHCSGGSQSSHHVPGRSGAVRNIPTYVPTRRVPTSHPRDRARAPLTRSGGP
ncbi:MAG: hypothetical protein JWM61_3032, partial [Micrococcaceae bacterium]|nr:hypothetical protein [Micrococcaceae bacterium]